MSSDEENIQCPDCGAAVRPGASFCFKCGKHFGVGGAGADAMESIKPADSAPVSTSVNTGELTEIIPDREIKAVEKEPAAAAPAVVAEPEDTAKPVAIKPKPEMATAASMRRKPKPPREKIEMVWEQPESSTNPIFVAGTVVIFILVIVIVVMVYILK
jgi:zinc-ribbon domain